MAYPFMELADRVRRHFNGAGNPHAESTLTFTDITTNDVSTTLHGFVPKAPNDLSKFLRGDGTWATELFEVGHHRVRVEPINLAVANSVVTGSGTTAAFAAGRGWQLNTGATNPSTASCRVLFMGSGGLAPGQQVTKCRRLEIQAWLADTFAQANSFIYLTEENVDTIPSATVRHLGIKNLNGVISFTTADGTTEQTTAITAFLTAATTAIVVITFDGTTARCYIDGTLRATHSTNVPTGTNGTSPVLHVFINNNASANARTMAFWCADALFVNS